jgi:hypothetical protein
LDRMQVHATCQHSERTGSQSACPIVYPMSRSTFTKTAPDTGRRLDITAM